IDEINTKIAEARKQERNAKWGSKAKDKAEALVAKLEKQREPLYATDKALRENYYKGHNEDIVETGDPAQRLGALGKLKVEKDAYTKIKELALAKLAGEDLP